MRLRLARAGGHGTRGTRERVGHDGRAQGRGGEEGGWGGVGLVRRGGTVGGRPHPRAPPSPQKSFPKNTVEPGSPANLWQRAKRHKLTVSANNRGPGCARDFAAVLENRAISEVPNPSPSPWILTPHCRRYQKEAPRPRLSACAWAPFEPALRPQKGHERRGARGVVAVRRGAPRAKRGLRACARRDGRTRRRAPRSPQRMGPRPPL